MLPKSVRTIEDGMEFVKKALNPKPVTANLNTLEALFAELEVGKH